MPRGLNKVQLIGYVGQDPDIKYTGTGTAVANLSIATTESWKDKDGEQQERTEWHRLVAWKKLAEIIQQYVHKGSRIYVEGKLQTRSWDDEKSGTKKYMTEIVIDQMLMLDNKGAQTSAPAQSDLSFPEDPGAKGAQDGLPF